MSAVAGEASDEAHALLLARAEALEEFSLAASQVALDRLRLLEQALQDATESELAAAAADAAASDARSSIERYEYAVAKDSERWSSPRGQLAAEHSEETLSQEEEDSHRAAATTEDE